MKDMPINPNCQDFGSGFVVDGTGLPTGVVVGLSGFHGVRSGVGIGPPLSSESSSSKNEDINKIIKNYELRDMRP